jgi:hypothetical protein
MREARGQRLPWGQDPELLERLLVVASMMDEPAHIVHRVVNEWLLERHRPTVALTTVEDDRRRVRMLITVYRHANQGRWPIDVRRGWTRAGVPVIAALIDRATSASEAPTIALRPSEQLAAHGDWQKKQLRELVQADNRQLHPSGVGDSGN